MSNVTNPSPASSGLLDTSVVVDYRVIPNRALPDFAAISTITLAELSAGPHFARDDVAEQARRQQVLQWTEQSFPNPLPFTSGAARTYGSVCLLVLGAGRKPRKYLADLLIASIAIDNGLPLYTRNPRDFEPLHAFLNVNAV